jgi:wyosine [tRNA(Phe)-imidazoG37] synthetase (radical SAM superfamily)
VSDSSPDRRLDLQALYRDHARRWRENVYVYAVLSRRSGGPSIGINLNPDKACNFDCIYCQVDRTTPPTTRSVDLAVLTDELNATLVAATTGELFRGPPFDRIPPENRQVADIAFSGDGEPTTCPQFGAAVQIAARARQQFGLTATKLVLITDACYLTRAPVQAALRDLDAANGEIWAKLDAGTQDYFARVNRPNFPLDHVIANIVDAARLRPVVIQSLWMHVHGQPPPPTEIDAYCDRLLAITAAGGHIKLVQLYTIARHTTEPYATALTNAELDALTAHVRRRVTWPVATYYGVLD